MAKKKTEGAQAPDPKNGGSDLGAQGPQAPAAAPTAAELKAKAADKADKAKTQKERLAAAAQKLSKDTEGAFGPGVGLVIPFTEKHSGKVVPAIVSELRLAPAVGGQPGDKKVEAVCLVLSAHTSRTYTAVITVKEA